MSDRLRILARIRGPRLFGREGMRAHCRLSLGQPLVLDREPSNPADPSAVIIRTIVGEPVGYVQRPHSARVASLIDSGHVLLARVACSAVTLRPGVWRLAVALIWDDGVSGGTRQALVRVPEPIDG